MYSNWVADMIWNRHGPFGKLDYLRQCSGPQSREARNGVIRLVDGVMYSSTGFGIYSQTESTTTTQSKRHTTEIIQRNQNACTLSNTPMCWRPRSRFTHI